MMKPGKCNIWHSVLPSVSAQYRLATIVIMGVIFKVNQVDATSPSPFHALCLH